MQDSAPTPPPAAAPPDSGGTLDATMLADRFRGIDWLHLLETWGLKLVAAVVIFFVGRWIAKKLTAGLERVLGRAQVDSTLIGFLRNVTYAVLLVLVIMTALSALSVPTTSMFAILGAAGLAVGLALKDSLSNIASGVMLIVLRPFRAGDHVVAAGEEGIVLEVRVFQTKIRTFDGRLITLPNSEVTTAPIENFSTLPTRRMMITVGVGYEDDLRKAKQILLDIARDEPMVVDDPAPFVQVKNLGESSVDLALFAHTLNADFGEGSSRVVEAIRDQIIGNGLSIPYPQRDLHVYHHDADGRPINDLLALGVDDGDSKSPPAT